jgi:hypothetical protein
MSERQCPGHPGVAERSRRYVFEGAGVPVAATLAERTALTDRIAGVVLGMSLVGNWEVRRWGRKDWDEDE